MKEVPMDTSFRVLQKKEIYEFLEGSGDQELVTYDNQSYGLPYHSASELYTICHSFGMSETPGGSRWTYMEALIQFAIDNNRCDELLRYLFDLSHFKNLQNLPDMNIVEWVHSDIVSAAVGRINQIIRFTRKELHLSGDHFYITDVGMKTMIQTPQVDALTTAYVRGLKERCEDDLVAGNFDSVITKSRTMIEEVLIQILEENNIKAITSGNIRNLYNQVKDLRNMQQNSNFDNRVNGLLGGLEKIVVSIGDMRNINSDAHGVGSTRISIREKEARLIMNSAITFCEYMLS